MRKSGAKILLVANKAEGKGGDLGIAEAARFGFGEVVPISAEHGENIVYMMQKIVEIGGDKITTLEDGRK